MYRLCALQFTLSILLLSAHSALVVSSSQEYQFQYPPSVNSSSIEVNYLDSINVSWTRSTQSTITNHSVPVLSIDCWKSNATNIGTCT